jgi:hypothetical protein
MRRCIEMKLDVKQQILLQLLQNGNRVVVKSCELEALVFQEVVVTLR